MYRKPKGTYSTSFSLNCCHVCENISANSTYGREKKKKRDDECLGDVTKLQECMYRLNEKCLNDSIKSVRARENVQCSNDKLTLHNVRSRLWQRCTNIHKVSVGWKNGKPGFTYVQLHRILGATRGEKKRKNIKSQSTTRHRRDAPKPGTLGVLDPRIRDSCALPHKKCTFIKHFA